MVWVGSDLRPHHQTSLEPLEGGRGGEDRDAKPGG